MATGAQPPVTVHDSHSIQVGDWQIDVLQGGRFLMDGGVLFGVVPRRLWEMVKTPDERNRLPCACNCILARDGQHTVLIDTGYGGKQSPLDRKFYALEAGEPILDSLQSLGLGPDDVDTVVLSHLHWDHVGGASRYAAGRQLVPTFPRARHVAGILEWEDAHSGAEELGGAYAPENITPLEENVYLELVGDNDQIVPGLRTRITGGHTRGHMALLLESNRETAIFLGDLCPSTNHLRRLWSLAYDNYPMETRRQKPVMLGEAADGNWIVLWSHDPAYAASRLARDPKREFVVTEAWPAS